MNTYTMHDDSMSEYQVRLPDTAQIIQIPRRATVTVPVTDEACQMVCDANRVRVMNLPGEAAADLFWDGLQVGVLTGAHLTRPDDRTFSVLVLDYEDRPSRPRRLLIDLDLPH